jgi:peptidoglycan/LPS O-acetylase OafA/YrhL
MSASVEDTRVIRSRARLNRLETDTARISRVPYLPGLDGMRAFAVVAVMIYHANSDWLKGGFLGVEVFFVISGYLITLLLVAESEKNGHVDLKQFWLRRARRLLPALYTMMLLLTVWTALFEREALGKLRGDVIAGLTYVTNWYQIWIGAGYTEANDFAPLRHLWSLAVEEQYYLIWPLVMVLLLRRGSRRVADLAGWLVVAAVAVTVLMAVLFYSGPIGTPEVTPDAYWTVAGRPISKIDTLYLSTVTRAGGLLLGGAFALLWRPLAVMRGPLGTKERRLDGVALVGLLGLLAMFVYVGLVGTDGADPVLFRGGFFVCGLATLMVVAAVTHERSWTSAALRVPVLLWIGTRSYGLYLFHWPIYQIMRGTTGNKLELHEFLVALAITAAITELSYRLIEIPVRKGALGRLWSRRNTWGGVDTRTLVGGGAAIAAVTVFAGASLATADLQQNEVRQSLDAGAAFTCDPLVDLDCDGVADVDGGAEAATGASAPPTQASETAAPRTTTAGAMGKGKRKSNAAAQGTATTAAEPAVPATTTAKNGKRIARLAVGDSVMKGAAEPLSEFGFVVDAVESRAFVNGLDSVLRLQQNGRLGDVVVVHLGTNGPIAQDDMDRMMSALADVPQVLLLTNDVDRDYTAGNNALIYATANQYANVSLLDWEGNAAGCTGDCFYSDGIHLAPDGRRYYAQLIAGALGIT